MIHDLKIEDNYLENLNAGKKRSEIRLNDRDYQKGDFLRYKRYPFGAPMEEYLFEIVHIHSGLGLRENYVVLSVVKIISDPSPHC